MCHRLAGQKTHSGLEVEVEAAGNLVAGKVVELGGELGCRCRWEGVVEWSGTCRIYLTNLGSEERVTRRGKRD